MSTLYSKGRIKLFISSVSLDKEVKVKQQWIIQCLEARKIAHEIFDIATNNSAKRDLRVCMLGEVKPPPQIVNGNDYCGDYQAFITAVNDECLEEFLRIEKPKKEEPKDPMADISAQAAAKAVKKFGKPGESPKATLKHKKSVDSNDKKASDQKLKDIEKCIKSETNQSLLKDKINHNNEADKLKDVSSSSCENSDTEKSETDNKGVKLKEISNNSCEESDSEEAKLENKENELKDISSNSSNSSSESDNSENSDDSDDKSESIRDKENDAKNIEDITKDLTEESNESENGKTNLLKRSELNSSNKSDIENNSELNRKDKNCFDARKENNNNMREKGKNQIDYLNNPLIKKIIGLEDKENLTNSFEKINVNKSTIGENPPNKIKKSIVKNVQISNPEDMIPLTLPSQSTLPRTSLPPPPPPAPPLPLLIPKKIPLESNNHQSTKLSSLNSPLSTSAEMKTPQKDGVSSQKDLLLQVMEKSKSLKNTGATDFKSKLGLKTRALNLSEVKLKSNDESSEKKLSKSPLLSARVNIITAIPSARSNLI